jgi:hypothetical protein
VPAWASTRQRANSKAAATFDAREADGEGDGEAEGGKDKVRGEGGATASDRKGEKKEGIIKGTLARQGGEEQMRQRGH